MPSLTSNAAISATLQTPASSADKVNVFTVPNECFKITHGVSSTNNPMVRFESIYQNDKIGTIQIFANSGHEQELLEAFPEGAVDGSKLQDVAYFSHSKTGSNYRWEHNPQVALDVLQMSGQNSSVMIFPEANVKLTREQAQDYKNLNKGSINKIAVGNENRLMAALGNLLK